MVMIVETNSQSNARFNKMHMNGHPPIISNKNDLTVTWNISFLSNSRQISSIMVYLDTENCRLDLLDIAVGFDITSVECLRSGIHYVLSVEVFLLLGYVIDDQSFYHGAMGTTKRYPVTFKDSTM